MTEVRGGVFSPEDARKIHAKVLGISNQQPALVGSQMQQVQNLLYYVLLTEDLAAATDAETGYTQAEGRVLRYVQPVDASTLDMEQSTTSQGLITITNRFPFFSAYADDLILVVRNAAEYSPVFIPSLRKQVMMKEDLLAAPDAQTDPSTAAAYIMRPTPSGDLETTDREITIVNRFQEISVDAGTYAKAEWIDGEWQLYAADCSTDLSFGPSDIVSE